MGFFCLFCFFFKIGMAFLASKELDGVEEKHLSQVPLPTGSFLLPQTQTSLLAAIIRLWPLGLVLANAAAGVRGFQRKLVVWACLQLRMGSPSSYTVQTAQEHAGVTSIRALPQVSCVAGQQSCPRRLWAPHMSQKTGAKAHESAAGTGLRLGQELSRPCSQSWKPELPTWLQVWVVSVIMTQNFPEPFSLYKNCL